MVIYPTFAIGNENGRMEGRRGKNEGKEEWGTRR